jgi:hypothetical protein
VWGWGFGIFNDGCERIGGRTGLVNLPKPDNCLLFIEQLKVNQYKVYNIGNIENMVRYKRGKGHVLSVERHP